MRQCERLVELDEKLPGILEGKTTPASPDERIELAELCSFKRLNRAAARFYEEAFAERRPNWRTTWVPPTATTPPVPPRWPAAVRARTSTSSTRKSARRLRRQALDWLRADLEAWKRLLDKEPDKVRPIIVQQMRHWLADTDFAGVRGPQALAKLPEAERQPWQKLWDDVANTLARAQASTTPEKKSAAK